MNSNAVVGRVVGTWKVVQKLERNSRKGHFYRCRCECGEEIERTTQYISMKRMPICQNCNKGKRLDSFDKEAAVNFITSFPSTRVWDLV